jgi:hypothetical protein
VVERFLKNHISVEKKDLELRGTKMQSRWVWWCTPVIPALRRWRKEDQEFKASLRYIDLVSTNKQNWSKYVRGGSRRSCIFICHGIDTPYLHLFFPP